MPYTDTLPSKADIFLCWKDRFPDLGIFIDWGEPSCWACGFHYGSKYDIRRSDAGWPEILSGWERMPLQRCHIVPRSLGGSDAPENLFLMCRECHDTAPNTNIPSIFLAWAKAQSSWRRETEKIEAACRAFDVGEAEKDSILTTLQSEDFRAWSADRVGLHRPQSNYPSTLSRLTPATLIGLAVEFQRSAGRGKE